MTEITEYRRKKNEDSLRDFWDNIKCTKIHMIGDPEQGSEKKFEEIIAENFPNVGKEIVNQVQEVQRISGRINPWRVYTDTHINQTDKN